MDRVKLFFEVREKYNIYVDILNKKYKGYNLQYI